MAPETLTLDFIHSLEAWFLRGRGPDAGGGEEADGVYFDDAGLGVDFGLFGDGGVFLLARRGPGSFVEGIGGEDLLAAQQVVAPLRNRLATAVARLELLEVGDGLEFLWRGFGLPGGAGLGLGFGIRLAALAHVFEGGLVEVGGGEGIAAETPGALATDAGFGGAFQAVDGAQHVGDGEGGEPCVGGVDGVEGGELTTSVGEYFGAALGGA